jgi:hypothetical protein
MDDVYAEIGQAVASAELEVARATGQLVGFAHRDALPVPLWVTVLSQELGTGETSRGKLNQAQRLRVLLPSQPPAFSGASGFSGTQGVSGCNAGLARDVVPGDRIEWPVASARYFWVDEDVEATDNGYCYVVRASQSRTLTAGARS